MRSGELLKAAEKVMNENPEMLEALMIFERTKKLPKINYKKRANFTIDENILRQFRAHCRKKGYKMSNRIEKLMIKEVTS